MCKKFIILFLVSTNCFAQNTLSRDQVGVFYSECAAYQFHGNIWNIKLGDIAAANQFKESSARSLLIADKLIGETKSLNIFNSTSKLIGSYQSDSKAYLNYIFSGIKRCHDFVKQNHSAINSLVK